MKKEEEVGTKEMTTLETNRSKGRRAQMVHPIARYLIAYDPDCQSLVRFFIVVATTLARARIRRLEQREHHKRGRLLACPDEGNLARLSRITWKSYLPQSQTIRSILRPIGICNSLQALPIVWLNVLSKTSSTM